MAYPWAPNNHNEWVGRKRYSRDLTTLMRKINAIEALTATDLTATLLYTSPVSLYIGPNYIGYGQNALFLCSRGNGVYGNTTPRLYKWNVSNGDLSFVDTGVPGGSEGKHRVAITDTYIYIFSFTGATLYCTILDADLSITQSATVVKEYASGSITNVSISNAFSGSLYVLVNTGGAPYPNLDLFTYTFSTGGLLFLGPLSHTTAYGFYSVLSTPNGVDILGTHNQQSNSYPLHIAMDLNVSANLAAVGKRLQFCGGDIYSNTSALLCDAYIDAGADLAISSIGANASLPVLDTFSVNSLVQLSDPIKLYWYGQLGADIYVFCRESVVSMWYVIKIIGIG